MNRLISRRQFGLASAGAGVLSGLGLPLSAQAAAAVETLKILTGFPAGGTADALARRTAEKLRGGYANVSLVENKPGAAGQIGVIALRDSPADGSVMMVCHSSALSIYPYTYTKLQYKIEDITPVSLGAHFHFGFAVSTAVVPDSVKTLKHYLDWAKANGAKASVGNPGAGSMPHMIMALVERNAGVDLQHVPYRGSIPGVQDLLGGQISAMITPLGDYLQHLKGGKIRLLSVSGKARSSFTPDVPTFQEGGFPITVREWYGFFMPKGAKPDVVARGQSALEAALKLPEVVEAGKTVGLEIHSSSTAQLVDLLQADAAEWKGLIKQIGFTADT